MSNMQEYYAARAPEYDAVYLKPERQPDLRGIEEWLPTVFSAATVLEVACATGYWTQFFAPVASHVVAVDSAPETIRIAEQRTSCQKVEFIIADTYALPPFPRKFERGFAGFWFSHIPKSRVREFLLGFHAALEPGANVVLLDNRFVEGSSTAISERDAEGNTYQTRKLSNGTTHRVLKNFPSEPELRAVMRGLCEEAQYRTWKYFWALEYVVAVP
jgi:SAM-dependent methyltransferase